MKTSDLSSLLFSASPRLRVSASFFFSASPRRPLLASLSFIPHPSALIPFILLACLLVALVVAVAASRHKKGAGTPLELIGRVATVERDLEPEGAVLVCGELMPARSRSGEWILRASCARVRVVGARGHCLEVEPEA